MGAHNIELRDQPAYTLAEAARYLKLPAATLRSWTIGRNYPAAGRTAHFSPLIQAANTAPTQLSFYNLIEAHVLRSLRVGITRAFSVAMRRKSLQRRGT